MTRAIAHAIDELRHVVVERGVLLVQRNALLQEADAGAEKSSRMRASSPRLNAFSAAFSSRSSSGVQISSEFVGLRHREVEQAELQAREMELGIDVERAAHLHDGFRIFATLRELGAEQIAQFGVARITGDGGAQSRDLWRIHGHRLDEVSGSIAQGFAVVWAVFPALCKARSAGRPGPRMPTTTPDSQRPIRDIGTRRVVRRAVGPSHDSRTKAPDNAV